MINTYHTSVAPPPLPPRLGRSQPVLIPAQLPAPGSGKGYLIHFLLGVVTLHLLLSVVGFMYLYSNKTQPGYETSLLPQGRVGFSPLENQETTYRTLAHMDVEKPKKIKEESGYLQWNHNHGVFKNTNYYESSWLTILEPGDYFVYARVSFSKRKPRVPLVSHIKLRKKGNAEEEIVMKAYCSIGASTGSVENPDICTATQEGLITLETGNQLGVWVEDLSLVDYEREATSFGIYKL